MAKKHAPKPARKHRLREKQHGPVDFNEIKHRVEGALKGSGMAPDINRFGEVVFKPLQKKIAEAVKPRVERGEAGKESGEGRGKANQITLGIPELDRILEEKMLLKARDIQRIKTGIPGMDDLITGGIPRDSTIALVGSPGAGKTIFGLQFLYNGAVLFNEPGIYISFEEEPSNLFETGGLFGWDFAKLDKQKKVQIMFKDPYEIKSFATAMGGQIYSTIRESKVKRIVFDSITYFSLTQENQFKLRKEITDLRKRLKGLDITTLLVSEVPEDVPRTSQQAAEEFAVDGVIRMHNLLIHGTRQRAVEVMKLRKTSHDTFLHPFAITNRGIVVYPKEQVVSE